MSNKLGENIKVIAGNNPAALSAGAGDGILIDRLGYFDAVVHLNIGAASGTPTAQGVEAKVQTGEKSDGSDLADVTGAVIAKLEADNKEAELNIDLNGYGRYIKVIPTVSFTGGTTPKIPVAVTVALGNSVSVPV